MKNLVLASQNETIRILPGERVTPGTIDVDVCHVEILRAENGRVSLTHVDRLTDPKFIKEELKWLRDGDNAMPVHRISVRTEQTDEQIKIRMNERLAAFDKAVAKIPFASTTQKMIPPKNIVLYSPRSQKVTTSTDDKLAALDENNARQILQTRLRMLEYTVNCIFMGAHPKNSITPPVVYSDKKWEDKMPTFYYLLLPHINAILEAPPEAQLATARNRLWRATANPFNIGIAPGIVQVLSFIKDTKQKLGQPVLYDIPQR